MEPRIRAQLRNLKIAPRKVRLAADLIRGMDVERAERELLRLTNRSAAPLHKLLRSAAANAKQNFQLSPEGLYVREIRVDAGSVLKRFRPRAFGRSAPIRRRTSHVSVVLDRRGGLAPLRRGRRAAPEVTFREVAPAEARKPSVARPESPTAIKKTPRRKAADFVRRVFQRKAI